MGITSSSLLQAAGFVRRSCRTMRTQASNSSAHSSVVIIGIFGVTPNLKEIAMGEIGPRFKRAELEKSGLATVRGDGISEGLRGVTADALKMDPAAHQTNRELARKIQQLVS